MVSNAPRKTATKGVWRRIPIVIAVCLGIVVSLLGYYEIDRRLRVEVRDAVEGQATAYFTVLVKELDVNLELVAAVAGLYRALDIVGREDFTHLTQPVLTRRPAFWALSWLQRVLSDERAAFEESMRDRGIPDFVITHRLGNTVVQAKPSEEYFPIIYTERYQARPRRRAIGLDPFGTPLQRAAMLEARETGVQVAGFSSAFAFTAGCPLLAISGHCDTE